VRDTDAGDHAVKDELALLGGPPAAPDPPPCRWPTPTEADVVAVAAQTRRGELSYTGREGSVARLEDAFLDYFGTTHALATNSGTAALHSAYFGIGLEPGDEVLAPTYTFLATVMPIFATNAVPVLIDADEWTGNLDPALLAAHVTPRTKAIVVTHLNGYPAPMAAVMAVAHRHDLRVVEDCSQAHGARCDGRLVGTFGDVAAFSLQANKLVPAGEGGMVLTNDRQIYERAVMLGHFADRAVTDVHSPELAPLAHTAFGLNLRIHPLGATLATAALGRLDDTIAARARNFELLDGLLDGIDGVRPPVRLPHMTRPVHYSYQPLYRPDELGDLPVEVFARAVAAEGVPLTRPRSRPLHCQPAFQRPDIGMKTYGHFGLQGAGYRVYAPGDLPKSEAYLARALRLPAYTEDIRPYAERIGAAFAKVARHTGVLHDLWRRDALPNLPAARPGAPVPTPTATSMSPKRSCESPKASIP
jgi:dTDP-4-amino-4,6-dideoxygalactose transaminase